MDGVRHATGIGSAPKLTLTKTSEQLPLKGLTVLCCEVSWPLLRSPLDFGARFFDFR